jgi:hypothetical protein
MALSQAAPIQLLNGKPLPGNKLTAHTIGLVKWNTQLDKALLGARITASIQKGWNEVLPFARVLDDSLKPATTPEEELQRNEQLSSILGKLKNEVPLVASSIAALASKFASVVPKSFVEICGRLNALAASGSYQQFDAAVRESYNDKEKFAQAFSEYDNARKLYNNAIELNQARDYLAAACPLNVSLETDCKALLSQLDFQSLFTSPHVIGARLDSFKQWKQHYVHAYRKGHRAYYEELDHLGKTAEPLRPRVIALSRLNTVIELGPPHPGTATITAQFEKLQESLWVCVDAAEADVAGANAICPKCGWKPEEELPTAEYDRVAQAVTRGVADRFQRLKDASISVVLGKAESQKSRPDLTGLLEIIQLADAEKLANVMTEDLAAFLRQLLQEANIVQETIELTPILQQIGAIEEDRVDEAISKFTSLLRNAIKDAKAKHGAGKRLRVFLRTGNDPS